MKTIEAEIVKIGNSQGVRLKRSYLDGLDLHVGDSIELTVRKKKPDYKKALAALEALSKLNGTLSKIEDPVAWQRKIRKNRPLLGRS